MEQSGTDKLNLLAWSLMTATCFVVGTTISRTTTGIWSWILPVLFYLGGYFAMNSYRNYPNDYLTKWMEKRAAEHVAKTEPVVPSKKKKGICSHTLLEFEKNKIKKYVCTLPVDHEGDHDPTGGKGTVRKK